MQVVTISKKQQKRLSIWRRVGRAAWEGLESEGKIEILWLNYNLKEIHMGIILFWKW